MRGLVSPVPPASNERGQRRSTGLSCEMLPFDAPPPQLDRPASEHWPCQGLRNLKRLEMNPGGEISRQCEQLSMTTLQKSESCACTAFYGVKQFTEATKDAPMYWRCVAGNDSHCVGSPWFTCNGKRLDDEDCPSANRSPAGHATACDYAVSVIASGEPTRRVRSTAPIACPPIALPQLRLPVPAGAIPLPADVCAL